MKLHLDIVKGHYALCVQLTLKFIDTNGAVQWPVWILCDQNSTLHSGAPVLFIRKLCVYFDAALTTTPTTTPPTTTTTPPAQSNCGDLTGRWQSSDPDATLCLIVNHDDGSLDGMFRNASETFWLRVTGKTRQEDYSESAFVLIWPANAIGVTSFAGQKRIQCHFYELLLSLINIQMS